MKTPNYQALLDAAKANPFRFFTIEETGEICGFGKGTMTAIVAAGAPVVGCKLNPQILLEWIRANAAKVGKAGS